MAYSSDVLVKWEGEVQKTLLLNVRLLSVEAGPVCSIRIAMVLYIHTVGNS